MHPLRSKKLTIARILSTKMIKLTNKTPSNTMNRKKVLTAVTITFKIIIKIAKLYLTNPSKTYNKSTKVEG
jgi:hypothetical protein